MNLAARSAAFASFALTVLAPALVLACPGSGGAGSACGSCGAGLGIAPAVSLGLLVGLGSVVLESVLRRRRE